MVTNIVNGSYIRHPTRKRSIAMTKRRADGHQNWTEADIPDLSGRTAVVTGANAGLGL